MNFKKLTEKCRGDLLNVIETILDTRDKRYIFIRMEFSRLLPLIDLEESPRQTAWNIYSEFEKQSMLDSLISILNAKFDTEIEFELI